MKIIKINNCNKCPYFDTEMDNSDENYGDLLCLCDAIPEIPYGAKLIENKGKELSNKLDRVNKDYNDNYELNSKKAEEENNKYFGKLKIEIPNWCPLENCDEIRKESL